MKASHQVQDIPRIHDRDDNFLNFLPRGTAAACSVQHTLEKKRKQKSGAEATNSIEVEANPNRSCSFHPELELTRLSVSVICETLRHEGLVR